MRKFSTMDRFVLCVLLVSIIWLLFALTANAGIKVSDGKYELGDIVSISKYSDDLDTALASIGYSDRVLLVINTVSTCCVDADTNMPDNIDIYVTSNGRIDHTDPNNYSLAINGWFDAGRYTCFGDPTAGIELRKVDHYQSEWFDANSTDYMVMGDSTLRSNTTGNHNVVVGDSIMESVTTGYYNVGIGINNLSSLTTGHDNIAIGDRVLNSIDTEDYNIGIGHGVMESADGALRNIGVGSGALVALTSGDDNIAIGYNALLAITSDSKNVAIGSDSLKSCVTGEQNVALGYDALGDCTGDYNLGVGTNAGDSMTSGNRNTFVGQTAGHSATTGSYNVIVGQQGLGSLTTGEKNVSVGAACGIDGSGSQSSSITIGYRASASGDNTCVIGSDSSEIFDFYIGCGETREDPNDIIIHATGGSGTDNYGADITIASGKGTGAGDGGEILFQVSDANSTGAYLTDLDTKMKINADGFLVLPNTHTPAGSWESGDTGQIAWDDDYIYVWTSPNTPERAVISWDEVDYYYSEFYWNDNSTATVIETADTPIMVRNTTTGLVSGWTYHAGTTGAITAYSDGTGKVNVADAGHGLVSGDIISIRGTTNYNGVWEITRIDPNNFSIPDTWVANDGASDWDQGDYLLAGANAAGIYTNGFTVSIEEAGAAGSTINVGVYKNATPCPKCVAYQYMSNANPGSVSGHSLMTIVAADRISITVESDGVNNLTVSNGDLSLYLIH